jgi:hypothetical protein
MLVTTSEIEDYIEYLFHWSSLADACPKCRSLNGKVWHGQNLFNPTLRDDVYGDIWDLNADVSLMHGASGTCRCHLQVEVIFNEAKFLESLQLIEKIEKVTK